MTVAPLTPIASASFDCVPHCSERTSRSTCHADAEPPASAIARSNAWVAAWAVRVRRRPMGGKTGGGGHGRHLSDKRLTSNR